MQEASTSISACKGDNRHKLCPPNETRVWQGIEYIVNSQLDADPLEILKAALQMYEPDPFALIASPFAVRRENGISHGNMWYQVYRETPSHDFTYLATVYISPEYQLKPGPKSQVRASAVIFDATRAKRPDLRKDLP